MKIELKELRINNFKGITNKVIRFGRETSIHGANATGKTTIADAFFWLIFGKNSQDDKNFGIKNTVLTDLNELDHEVEAVLVIDGDETTLRHVYREKWQRKRGAETKTFVGNENEYFWNDIPCQLKDWNARIAKLIEEDLFKKITNPAYFNMIEWTKRRETLIAMAGPISIADIVGENKDLQALVARMKGTTLKDYRATLAARKTKLKKELDEIPARIDELKKTLPAEGCDFEAIQKEADSLAAELNEVDTMLSSQSATLKKFHADQSGIQSEIHLLSRKAADLRNKLRIELENQDRDATNDISTIQMQLTKLDSDIKALELEREGDKATVENLNASIKAHLEKWKAINQEVFEYPEFEYDPNEDFCPHCKQTLPQQDINTRKETLRKNDDEDRLRKETAFNYSKANRKADNVAEGKRMAEKRDAAQKRYDEVLAPIGLKQVNRESLAEKLKDLRSQFTAPEPIEQRLEAAMRNSKEALAIEAALKAQKALVKEEPQEDNADLKARKNELASRITELTKLLGLKDTIANTEVRIENLQAEEKNFSQQQAEAEGEERLLLQFEKARMEYMSTQVNGCFKYVTFKLFETAINGGESACCETMLDGVPYSDLNTAGKIKAGIDIINALSNHYKVWAPIFLDNRESVTEIPHTDSQVINLIVSPADQKLRIETAQMEEAI